MPLKDEKDVETTESLDEQFKEIVSKITCPEDIKFLSEEIKKILNDKPYNKTVH
jgi:hypothetical protein